MDTITLSYYKSSVLYSQGFNALSVRGFREMDSVQFFPLLQMEMADGSKREFIKGFRRVITVDLGVVQTDPNLRFIQEFLSNEDRYLTLSGEGIKVIGTPDGFENEWLENCELMRRYVLELVEDKIRTVWPETSPAAGETYMYLKSNVAVSGTEASPETFTTNAGKLTVRDNGEVYPAINLTLFDAHIVITCHNSTAVIARFGSITQSGTDIAFQLALANIGNPYATDGLFYADIGIYLEAKP